MSKKLIRKIMPDHEKIRDNKYLKIFGRLLHDPNLWHLNRRSVSGAFAIGLFFAWIPVPFQMVLAAAAAILLRMNLPISVALVWITNPITMPPMFIGTYFLGAWLLNLPAENLEHKFREFDTFWDGMLAAMGEIWQPFLLGCLVAGIISSILGYLAIRALWRWQVIKEWDARKQRQLSSKKIE